MWSTLGAEEKKNLWKKLAYLTLKIKDTKLILRDSYRSKPVDCRLINNFIAIYNRELYALPVGYNVLGDCVPEEDLLGLCYLLVKYMKIEGMKRNEDMKIFGMLISLSSACGDLYYLGEHELDSFEEKVLRRLSK